MSLLLFEFIQRNVLNNLLFIAIVTVRTSGKSSTVHHPSDSRNSTVSTNRHWNDLFWVTLWIPRYYYFRNPSVMRSAPAFIILRPISTDKLVSSFRKVSCV